MDKHDTIPPLRQAPFGLLKILNRIIAQLMRSRIRVGRGLKSKIGDGGMDIWIDDDAPENGVKFNAPFTPPEAGGLTGFEPPSNGPLRWVAEKRYDEACAVYYRWYLASGKFTDAPESEEVSIDGGGI